MSTRRSSLIKPTTEWPASITPVKVSNNFCVCSFPAPLLPHTKGQKKPSVESPIHLQHNGTPQRFSSCFHLPPRGRFHRKGVLCPVEPASTQLPSAVETFPPPIIRSPSTTTPSSPLTPVLTFIQLYSLDISSLVFWVRLFNEETQP